MKLASRESNERQRQNVNKGKVHILIGRNTDEDLNLNYVMATTGKVEISGDINIEPEKSKTWQTDDEMTIAQRIYESYHCKKEYFVISEDNSLCV